MLQQQRWRTGHVQRKVLTGSRRGSMAPGFVSVVGTVYTSVADTRYLSIYLLRRARRNVHFDPPNLGDRPSTGELIAPLYHSLLLLRSPSLRTQLWPTGRQSPPSSTLVLQTALYQAGGGRLSTVPCLRFNIAGRGRLSTVPLVRFYIADGVRTALYRPLCSVLYLSLIHI